MRTKHHTKLVQVGNHVAEVDVELIQEEGGWSPYLSVEDAQKLDLVRDALKTGDLRIASQHARVYHLTPVEV